MKVRIVVTLVSPSFFLLFLPFSALLYTAVPVRRRAAAFLFVSVLFSFFAFGGVSALILLLVTALTLALSHTRYLAVLPAFCALVMCRLCSFSCGGLSFLFLRAAAYAFYGERKRLSPTDGAIYLLAFPSLWMGPVALLPAFSFSPACDTRRRFDGLVLYAVGFFKKCAFADVLYAAVARTSPPASALGAWTTLSAFCLGLYFDFSGYTDMARGLAEMFGITLPQNFDHPYAARSVSDFFRRWHISFGKLLYTYVYLPLGGSRCGRARTLLSLFAVWLCSSLWHGATVCYLLWGAWFFLLSAAEKLVFGGRGIGNVGTLLCVWLGFVFFLCPTPQSAASFFSYLFCLGARPLFLPNDLYHFFRLLPLFLLSFFISRGGLSELTVRLWKTPLLVRCGVAVCLFCVGLCDLLAGGHRPFLYAAF